ncbi:protein phosphatase 2C domain-containing protein [Natronosporangium hydrolyticum]|uniref:Protein phosphatase 2C domain-containing protein n=1 Tax=Natronosporangium hydrolyticum TaxID=2811111 RepID=A0A895YJ14_9ACTN|nr:protein phosphatase 2C domain-containing protein [Natronosporangium hydrolyticum]QSB14586.1 protein phosphatase 2C domain-containing protein [Natronosporangium hydrolyticum]
MPDVYISTATEAGDSGQNEDWVGTCPTAVVVLDGVSAPPGTSTGCRHGTAWYVNQLGSRLLLHLAGDDLTPDASLSAAIRETADAHAGTCDLRHPGTPSAAVAILQLGPEEITYLVLADTVVVLDVDEKLTVVTDDRVTRVAADAHTRTQRHPVGSPAHIEAVAELSRTQRLSRNQPGGYWVAGSAPEAADEAITGSVPRRGCRRAAVLTDGASRVVDGFGLATWEELLDRLVSAGPADLIAWTRSVERDDTTGERWPRYKASDDATAVYLNLESRDDSGAAGT